MRALIDRDKAVANVKELFSWGDCSCDEYSIVGMLNSMDYIEDDTENDTVEQAAWIRDEKRFGDNKIRCSKCGAILTEEEYKWKNNYYCYHCGSPMMINRWKGLYECVNKTGSGTDVL